MCDMCTVLSQWFNDKNCNIKKQYENYYSALRYLKEKVLTGEIEFVAGNSLLEDIEVPELDELYAPNHFFRCPKCRQNFQLSVNRMGLGLHLVDKIPDVDYCASSHYWKGTKKKFGTWTKTKNSI